MKVMRIGIKSDDEARRDLIAAFEAARSNRPFKPIKGVYFTNLEAARNFLTPRRIELLGIIKKRSPRSLYELSKLAKRSFASVHLDVTTLAKHGLLKLTHIPHSPRRAVHPTVSYDSISLAISL